MALTELQLPAKETFYANLQAAANEMDRIIKRWENVAEFIGRMDIADLDAMGVAAGQIRTDLIDFRIVIDEMLSLWNGNAVTPINPPHEIVDKIRTM